jgi:pimeloyl-ACP methyl ester carboxylesterase
MSRYKLMSDQTKVAILVIPGVGKRDEEEYEREVITPLEQRCHDHIGDGAVLELVHWTPILREEKERLKRGYNASDPNMNYDLLRRFFVGMITDMIAYQPQGSESHTYLQVHREFAEAMDRLSRRAGPEAPLVIVAHSLGAVIASNYLRELQEDTYKSDLVPQEVHDIAGDTPIERGETLAQMYTLGTILALYSVRHKEFDDPMRIPAPKLSNYFPAESYPDLPTQWLNFYDHSDVLSFPLSFLNEAYNSQLEDRLVDVGGLLDSWNPASHLAYWNDETVLDTIEDGIVRLYEAVNKTRV